MLFFFTLLTDLIAMSITLWLALYLLGRGYPSKVTMRAVLALLALSGFFFGAYNNLFQQIIGTASLRAILLIIGLASWYSLSVQLTPEHTRKRTHLMEIAVYVFAGVAILLLFNGRSAFVGEVGNVLYVGRMGFGLPYILYSIFLILSSIGILYNLLSGSRVGLTPQGRFFLAASVFPIIEIGYGILALAITPPLPRLFQDLFLFLGIFLLGIFVARNQSLVERRTPMQDFTISGTMILGLSAIYTLLGWKWGLSVEKLATVAGFAILTHSTYDLVRELLERIRIRNEGLFRHQLRQLDPKVEEKGSLELSLQEGLELLCSTINASGGFIAVRKNKTFIVQISYQSIALGMKLPINVITCEDICQPKSPELTSISWIAPAFDATGQVVTIGINLPETKLHYTSDDLDLLAEVADRVGILVSQGNTQNHPGAKESGSQSGANEMVATIKTNPDPELVKMVEEALRNLSDYITLGQLPLVEQVNVIGDSHVERGKNLQKMLTDAITLLRPPGQRPAEPLPRVWTNYVVLHDAYIEDVPNREIMARLYISEGTFNRTRRNALRGLSRLLLETGKLESQ